MLWCLGSLVATGFITCAIMFSIKRSDNEDRTEYAGIVSIACLVVSLGWMVAAFFFGVDRGMSSMLVLCFALLPVIGILV